MRQESDVEQTIGQYADMVKHICFVYMKNESDTEDVFQDVFLKYALFSEPFDSEEHKKAWLIRVTVNLSLIHILTPVWPEMIPHSYRPSSEPPGSYNPGQ